MKKQIVILSLISMLIFVNASDKISSYLLTVCGPHPILPKVALDYSLPSFPWQFDNTLGIELGYTSIVNPITYTEETNNIDDNKATLGRVLFYDKILSSNESISCASCHLQELSFSDGKTFSEGLNGPTKRNSLHLNDLAWDNHRFLSWDMEMETLSDMISLPLNDKNEIAINTEELIDKMFNTIYYPSLFQIAYQNPLPSEEKIVESLVHFIKSMNTFNSRLDQQARVNFEDFTVLEQQGKTLFKDKCATCHIQGSAYYINPTRNFNGLPPDPNDLGAGEWNPESKGLFRTPTLRNIELTAPYMHNGRHGTLEQVVKHYSDSIVSLNNNNIQWVLPEGGFKFTDTEQEALVAFMKTFTDSSFTTNEKWSDPFLAPTSTIDFADELDIKLAPNPMDSHATITVKNEKSEDVELTIYSQGGQEISKDIINTNQYQIEKGKLNPGIYFIKVQIGSKINTKKLIVN